jgi:hypothetical protein
MALFGVTDAEISKPKWLSAEDAAKAFFVSSEEAALASNKAKGIKGPGWYLIKTKDEAGGNQRTFMECLVALANATALNSKSGDATDDLVVADVEFAITTQPSAASVTAPAAATFGVVVSVPAGATYQWQQKTGAAAYANIANGGVYSTATTATLNISNSTGLNGVKYRCVITNAASTAQVTSKGAELTVA